MVRVFRLVSRQNGFLLWNTDIAAMEKCAKHLSKSDVIQLNLSLSCFASALNFNLISYIVILLENVFYFITDFTLIQIIPIFQGQSDGYIFGSTTKKCLRICI